jgi:4-hydroxybenzoyl-CoA thioesterase
MSFKFSRPLRFGECDLSGIAYHPHYFSILVDVNEAMFAAFGISWKEILIDRKLGLPTVSYQVEFLRTSTYGDILDFDVKVRAIGRSSLDLETQCTVRGEVIFNVKQRIVCTSVELKKSTPWPDDIRVGLTSFQEPILNA